MEKATKQMVNSTSKMFQNMPNLQKALKEKGPMQSKQWKCKACDTLHNNPKCLTCRACGTEREATPGQGDTKEQPTSKAPKGKGKGKGKGKDHQQTMEQLKALQLAMTQQEEDTMQVDEDKVQAEDNPAKIKELQELIDGLAKIPGEHPWVKKAIEEHKAKLATLKAPAMSANAEMAKVLKLESMSMTQFETMSQQVDKKVANAREQMEAAQKLLKEAEEEQKVLEFQQEQAKEQFVITKELLAKKQSGDTSASPAPQQPAAGVLNSPEQVVGLVQKSIAQYAPSQEILGMGVSPEQLKTILNNFASSIVLTQASEVARQTEVPPGM